MTSTTVTFDCECGEQLETDVDIDSHGSPAQTYGDPEGCYPAEGAQWHATVNVTCDECGKVYTADEISERDDVNDQVQANDAAPER